MSLETAILNSDNKRIVLNDREVAECAHTQALINATGYMNTTGFEIPVTTLTAIAKRVSEQKYFEITPSDYMPVRVGEGAWSTSILTYQTGSIGGDFTKGVINMGANKARLASSETVLQSVNNPVRTWAEEVSWSLPELSFALRGGNWNIVEAKEAARKKIWDLGIQAIAFVGNANLGLTGLLNQAGITTNTTFITKFISSMSPTEFAAFVQGILGLYRVNSNYTVFPDTFVIPELDYDGLMTPVSPTYPNVSMYDYLLKAFRDVTRNPNFEILPNRYADNTGNASALHIYALYRRGDQTGLVMDLPVPYTTTTQNTVNGFQWQNVAYGQFTGPLALRPLEMLYFTF